MNRLHLISKNHAGPIGVVAMVTWAVVGYLIIDSFPAELGQTNRLLTYAFIVLFFLGMQISWFKNFSSIKVNKLGLLLMCLSTIGLGWSQPTYTYLIMVVMLSTIFPYFYSIIQSTLILVLLYGITIIFALYRWQYYEQLSPIIVYMSFSAFAFFSSYTAQKEHHAREELAIANQQMLATQQLLMDSAINDERLRISRNLHDAIGHHLTAMSLQLEVARKLSKDKAFEHIQQAHSIAKLLLADVRDVVSDIRMKPMVDIRNGLHQLANSAKANVNLAIDENVKISNTKIVEAIFRLVQEMITNSNRHSRTGQLNIHLIEFQQGWSLTCDDGGTKSVQINPGAGIQGMRERVGLLNGHFELVSERGLRYFIQLPKYD